MKMTVKTYSHDGKSQTIEVEGDYVEILTHIHEIPSSMPGRGFLKPKIKSHLRIPLRLYLDDHSVGVQGLDNTPDIVLGRGNRRVVSTVLFEMFQNCLNAVFSTCPADMQRGTARNVIGLAGVPEEDPDSEFNRKDSDS